MSETETGELPAVKFCGAPTATGFCRQVVGILSASGRCIHHDPARAEEAEAMHRQAGQSSQAARRDADVPPPPAPKTLEDVIAWHSWVAVALASGQITKATASGTTYNLVSLRAALVSRDLEREVEQLRATVASLKPRRAG